MNIVAILPARGGSRRLPSKNLRLILGKPLIAWPAEAAFESKYVGVDRFYISTDDDEIARLGQKIGAKIVRRTAALSGPNVWTEPVIRHAVEQIEAELGAQIQIIIWLNASLPEVQSIDIDSGIEWLIRDNLREVIGVGANGITHSAVRVLRRDTLFQNSLSVHAGIMTMNYIDIHTAKDLAAVERRLQLRQAIIRK